MNTAMAAKKWALITGCPHGFADPIARALASSSYNLVLHGRNYSSVNNLCTSLRSEHPDIECHALEHDISSVGDASQICKKINAYINQLNVVVHHLGGTLKVRAATAPANEWQQVLLHNCLFSFELNRLLLPYLKCQNSARIINIGSVSSYSLRGSAPYACAKALLRSYTKTLGRELATSSVGVSYISLGAFETVNSNWAKYRQASPGIIDDFLAHHQASGRLGRPEEIIPVIKMLIDPAFSFGQGAVIDYDGGTM